MHETIQGGGEYAQTSLLSPTDREVITMRADLRRREQRFLSSFTSWKEGLADYPPLIRNQYTIIEGRMNEALAGQPGSTEAASVNGQPVEEMSPKQVAMYYAINAAHQYRSGDASYKTSLEGARKNIDVANNESIKTSPGDFLAEAIVIGVEKQIAGDTPVPSPEKVVPDAIKDRKLLADYALVLPETEREHFLSLFPEEQRGQISRHMDLAVSEVLSNLNPSDEADVLQQGLVFGRTEQAFRETLDQLVGVTSPSGELPKVAARELTNTLLNLSTDDSVALLRQLSDQSLDELKKLNKKLRKKPDEERARELRPFLSFAARTLRSLIEVDSRRGGTLTMRYLEMTVLPPRFYRYFCNKLINENYFTQNLTEYVQNDRNVGVLKRLMGRYGPQFNTIIDTLSQVPNYSIVDNEQEIFEALTDLGTLTPKVFKRYRSKSPEEKKEFAAALRELKPKFFRNQPIRDILAPGDRDILADLVYHAYQPVGMTFDQVAGLLERLNNQTDDLQGYHFPDDGYEVHLEQKRAMALVSEARLSLDSLRNLRRILSGEGRRPDEMQQEPNLQTQWTKAMQSLFSTEGQIDSATFLGILAQETAGEQSLVRQFLDRHQSLSVGGAYDFLNGYSEIVGVYFDDHYNQILRNFLEQNGDVRNALLGSFYDVAMRTQAEQVLQSGSETFDWNSLFPQQRGLDFLIRRNLTQQQTTTLADLMTKLVRQQIIMPVRKEVKGELTKFVIEGSTRGAMRHGELRAYISKNIGSFFAKAAAGICTKEDIPLFERDDHFHINVVENDERVRGNIQAYVTDVAGKKALVLRGFNPAPDWVDKIDPESFNEEVIRIGKEFSGSNGLAGVYITQQDGWHSLSNRDKIAQNLVGKYITGKKGVSKHLQVASGHDIGTVYPV